MTRNRLEAFSDGVIAILITIMVLELRTPESGDPSALRSLVPVFLSYLLSFVFLGIYWSNHHHMLHAIQRVNGRVLWANLHLLFWLSLVPFATAWMGAHPLEPWPAALYGTVLFLAAVAYFLLVQALIAANGHDSTLAQLIGRNFKGWLSQILYLLSIPLAFLDARISYALFITVAIIWFFPDRRIENLEE